MPPTFPIFLGCIAYLGLIGASGIVALLMLVTGQAKEKIKIILFTALISYPILIAVGLTLSVIFIIPGIAIGYLFYKLDVTYLTGIALLLFIAIVAVSSLYHWYLGFRMIKNYMFHRPVGEGIENDKIYSLFAKRIVRLFNIGVR